MGGNNNDMSSEDIRHLESVEKIPIDYDESLEFLDLVLNTKDNKALFSRLELSLTDNGTPTTFTGGFIRLLILKLRDARDKEEFMAVLDEKLGTTPRICIDGLKPYLDESKTPQSIENDRENILNVLETTNKEAFMLNPTKIKWLNEWRAERVQTVQDAPSLKAEPRREQPRTTEPARRKGRPRKTFKEIIADDADGRKLTAIHKAMDGQLGKGAALIMLACMKKGWIITQPTFTQVKNEFGDIGARQGFTKYLDKERHTPAEMDAALRSLE